VVDHPPGHGEGGARVRHLQHGALRDDVRHRGVRRDDAQDRVLEVLQAHHRGGDRVSDIACQNKALKFIQKFNTKYIIN